jgi:hypothetical protein
MILEATASAVFNSLLSAGLARIGTLAFHKVLRINKIEQHLKSGSPAGTPISTALHDLQIILGKCYGPYTEKICAKILAGRSKSHRK